MHAQAAFRWLFAGLTLLLALGPPAALADGKVFPRLEQIVTIPDQEAMITFDPVKGEQTLIIETRFVARGTDFAWVVPLPAGLNGGPPEVFAATTGTFPTLRTLFAPKIEWVDGTLAIPLALVAIMLLIGILVPKDFPPLHVTLYLLAALILAVCAGLPSLAKSRGMAKVSRDDDVEVLDRHIVGSFETTTIRSQNAAALGDWLAANGYVLDAEAQPVIADYIKRGWLFVASRLRRDSDTAGTFTPHPVGFRFTTPRAVYPLALTGVGNNGSLKVDLYIFGPGTAAAPGFDVVRTQTPQFVKSGDERRRSGTDIVIGHPRIIERAGGAGHATKLHAELTPDQMRTDAEISFGSARTTGNVLYSTQAAANMALNWGTAIAAFALLVILILRSVVLESRHRALRWIAWSAAAALIAGTAVFLALPRTDAVTERESFRHRGRWLEELLVVCDKETERLVRQAAARGSSGDASPEAVLRREILDNHRLDRYSAILPQLIGDLDTPGHAIIRRTADAVEYVYYDEVGCETVTRIVLQP